MSMLGLKMSATFANLKTKRVFRIIAKEEARRWATKRMPHIEDKYKAQLEAHKVMSDDDFLM